MNEAKFEAKFDDGSYCIGTLEYVSQRAHAKYQAGILMDHFGEVEAGPPAKAEGLAAPQWSDSGPVPVGEVTYSCPINDPNLREAFAEPMRFAGAPERWDGASFELLPGLGEVVTKWAQECKWDLAAVFKPSDPNAKPALSALGKVAGEEYRGLGWCDE